MSREDIYRFLITLQRECGARSIQYWYRPSACYDDYREFRGCRVNYTLTITDEGRAKLCREMTTPVIHPDKFEVCEQPSPAQVMTAINTKFGTPSAYGMLKVCWDWNELTLDMPAFCCEIVGDSKVGTRANVTWNKTIAEFDEFMRGINVMIDIYQLPPMKLLYLSGKRMTYIPEFGMCITVK